MPEDPREAFLAGTPAAGWRREALAGDASGRAYERLTGPDGATAILMDATAERASLGPFLRLAAHLRGLGLAAPEALAGDEAGGLLLLEDLGPRTVAAWTALHPEAAPAAYEAAVDLLPRLQGAPPPSGLVALTPLRAAGLIAPLFQHHAPGTDPRDAAALTGRLAEALALHAPDATVLSLRDYHAENLIWREDRAGADRLGLLDFQDAVLAPPEYDLASLLRDARADMDPGLSRALLARFARATGRDAGRVAAAAAVLGVQRNLRILGIFARLAAAGRPRYLALVPRVRAHVEADLAHPALGALRDAARAVLGRAPAKAPA